MPSKKSFRDRRVPPDVQFANHVIETNSAMSFYMTTDGLPTQVGEETRLPIADVGSSACWNRFLMSPWRLKVMKSWRHCTIIWVAIFNATTSH